MTNPELRTIIDEVDSLLRINNALRAEDESVYQGKNCQRIKARIDNLLDIRLRLSAIIAAQEAGTGHQSAASQDSGGVQPA